MTLFSLLAQPSTTPVPQARGTDGIVNFLLDVPLRIAITIVVALLVMLVMRVVIHRVTNRLARPPRPRSGTFGRSPIGSAIRALTQPPDERRWQRAHTVGSVVLSVVNVLIVMITLLLILDALNVNIAPFLASAGIAGVALGFGAQTLVKDFLSGIFMLLEDQYGVGDIVQVGEIFGTVESVAMRVTTIRDYDGTLWYVRNGEILSVGNKTQAWARAIVNVDVSADVDLYRARNALEAAIDALVADEASGPLLQERPTITGVENISAMALTLRVIGKTAPGEQWAVQRALRAQIRDALVEAGVPMSPGEGQSVVISAPTQPPEPADRANARGPAGGANPPGATSGASVTGTTRDASEDADAAGLRIDHDGPGGS